MGSARETNTMSEGLHRILNEITKMKVMPDGDLPFLVELETDIINYLRPMTEGAQGGEMGGMAGGMGAPVPEMAMAGGGGGMPMDMGGAPGPLPPLPPDAGTPANPVLPGGGISNPDELRRVLNL